MYEEVAVSKEIIIIIMIIIIIIIINFISLFKLIPDFILLSELIWNSLKFCLASLPAVVQLDHEYSEVTRVLGKTPVYPLGTGNFLTCLKPDSNPGPVAGNIDYICIHCFPGSSFMLTESSVVWQI